MDELLLIKYLKYVISNNMPLKVKWINDMFATIAEDIYEDEFVSIANGKVYIKIDDELLLATNKYTKPLLSTGTKITIDNTMLPMLNKKIDTTVGRLIMNYLLIYYPFKNNGSYINDKFNIGDIESNIIVPRLVDGNRLDINEKEVNGITVSELHIFKDMVNYVNGFNKLLSISATVKSIVKPKGLEEFKTKTIKELKAKYGENALSDPKVFLELESKLAAFDKEWLKDDLSNSKLMAVGKVKTARKKLFLTQGMGAQFEPDGTADHAVLTSLENGIPLDRKVISNIANEARAGSFGRGAETQLGGVTAKTLLRATADIKFITKDCGSTIYLDIPVSNSNKKYLLDRYIKVGTKLEVLTLDNIDNYVGKTVQMRSGLFCKENVNFCSTCLGDKVKAYPNGASLMSSGLGGDILKIALAKFHGTSTKTVKMSIAELS